MNTQTLPNHDFTNAKVGDPIYTVQFGEGTIVEINQGEHYPIVARFSDGRHAILNKKGIWHCSHSYPTAFTEPIKIVPASAEIFEEQEMMVWDGDDIKGAVKRIVFAKFRGRFAAIENTHQHAFFWQNALPVNEWETKVRENKNAARIKELEAEIAAKQSELNKLKG